MCVCESEKFSTTLAGRAFVEWDLRVCVCFFFSLTVRNLVSTFHFAMCSKTGRGKVGIELCAVETGMLALVCTFEMLFEF